MITSGIPTSTSTRTEIIDVIDAGTTCPDLAKFPLDVKFAVGANLQGVPIICGGTVDSPNSKRLNSKQSLISKHFW